MSHTIVHFEIPADNVDTMKEFYGEVFDWKVVDIPQMGYVMFHTVPTDEKGMLKEQGVNGGMYKRTVKNQTPVNYISVGSVDEFVERAVRAGGRLIVPKMHIPTVGYTAIIADPEGNPIGLMQPEM